MFQIGDTILSDRIATAKFACDVQQCKGSCCVVGESGAPVSRDEIPGLKRAYRTLKEELRSQAVDTVKTEGLIQGDDSDGHELSCVDGKECVFVTFEEDGIATCQIQKAYERGEIPWQKPVSCDLYPVRLNRVAGVEYANFEYIPELCSAGCDHGKQSGVWLSEFIGHALIRRYGHSWYEEFEQTCRRIRRGEV